MKSRILKSGYGSLELCFVWVFYFVLNSMTILEPGSKIVTYTAVIKPKALTKNKTMLMKIYSEHYRFFQEGTNVELLEVSGQPRGTSCEVLEARRTP